MRMESYRPRRKKGRWGVILVMLLLGAFGAIWYITTKDKSHTDSVSENPALVNKPEVRSAGRTKVNLTSEQVAQPAPGPAGMTKGLVACIGSSPITVTPVSRDQALADLRQGLKLYAQNDDLLRARRLLNRAYISGRLAEPQAIQTREALENLADRTVLKRDTYVNPEDPYTLSYTFRPGDMLYSRRKGGRVTHPGVIARNDLNVPAGGIVWVNQLRRPTDFRAGVSYKLLKGPFHMVVYKTKRAADVYVQDLFVRRVSVCVGAPETPTPEGYFRIVNGGKTLNSPYYPPAETGRVNVAIFPGREGYPLGPGGRNMKIEGITQLGTNIRASQSYAIHGTNDPSSIGRAVSRGCLRLRNDDMRFAYGAFQDYAAPNDPHATWTKWSTITIRP